MIAHLQVHGLQIIVRMHLGSLCLNDDIQDLSQDAAGPESEMYV